MANGMAMGRRPASLAAALASLRRDSATARTVGDVVHRLADRSAILVIMLAGAFAVIPSPGLPVGLVFGSVAALVALRMAFRPGRVTLPHVIARRPVPQAALELVARRAVPLLRRLERVTRPRLRAVASGIGATAAYLMVVVQAVLVALPIPFRQHHPRLGHPAPGSRSRPAGRRRYPRRSRYRAGRLGGLGRARACGRDRDQYGNLAGGRVSASQDEHRVVGARQWSPRCDC